MAAATLCPLPYFPTDQQAKSFWEATPENFVGPSRVPLGFPEQLVSPLAWRAEDVQARLSSYVVELTKEDVDAVESALSTFKGRSDVFEKFMCNMADLFPVRNIVGAF
jgi:hypothetical protein